MLRSISDKIMYYLISCFGRTPSNDTAIAYKISGPGMSRAFYNSVHEEDVYVLIQAELEWMVIKELEKRYYKRIGQHSSTYFKVMREVLMPYTANPGLPNDNIISKNEALLHKSFQNQFSQYVKRFPKHPKNIRFTKEELDKFFPNTIKIVENFLQK